MILFINDIHLVLNAGNEKGMKKFHTFEKNNSIDSFSFRCTECSEFIQANVRYSFLIIGFPCSKIIYFKARREFQCIGTTTLDKYQEYIEKDPTFEEHFQQILVKELSVTDCISILHGLKDDYELDYSGMTHSSLFLTFSTLILFSSYT